jgi:ankyrin repeat protein
MKSPVESQRTTDNAADDKPNPDPDLTRTSQSIKLKPFQETEYVTDVFGNSRLHQIFAAFNPDIEYLKKVLNESKDLAASKNQFGRLPLHYALDRRSVNIQALKLVLDANPSAANTEDNEGITPYDLSLKWGHPNEVRRLLLEADPSQDWLHLMELRWGIFAQVAIFVADPFKNKRRNMKILPTAGNSRDDPGVDADADAACTAGAGAAQALMLDNPKMGGSANMEDATKDDADARNSPNIADGDAGVNDAFIGKGEGEGDRDDYRGSCEDKDNMAEQEMQLQRK